MLYLTLDLTKRDRRGRLQREGVAAQRAALATPTADFQRTVAPAQVAASRVGGAYGLPTLCNEVTATWLRRVCLDPA